MSPTATNCAVRTAAFILALTVLPAGCGPAATPVAPASELEGTNWILSTLNGQKVSAQSPVTLAFEGGRISGTDGCNRFSGPYKAADAHLKIGPDIASTQMGCPSEVMRLASSYMSVLLSASGYRIADRQLQLVGVADTVLAAFAPPAAPQ